MSLQLVENIPLDELRKVYNQIKSGELVRPIRCIDCKHWKHNPVVNRYICEAHLSYTEFGDYCSKGEKGNE
jgi:hypothetical protein